ncbi:MAG: 3-phosphoshikimate 1-carboxyvinyltransferase [Planctomycetales bacterium]|nr:3-phosphoshikimate 1-carboxyvinyltransferase [Planctomycetales bacterium]NIM07985.1 3-phosphoshikimate 1-carboxyvinyltransferase [Planctomycetales bacterium]NIN07463.1 3-phosphoshikimate 1-carboxyvinyltransferase [Planctomycetales bacterium]NIN76569.1 3-phosphoshikimate 1-carboxyvinyltransferase [Planctomycetales bacterium]NIO33757.1 3-phosphoshikimate 1-carboxyvinyltransferase [Planctomycetales bacterium]
MHWLTITPAPGPVCGTVRPPGSKSITNRALICAALAKGQSTLQGTLDSEDTRVMVAGLQALGIAIDGDLGQAPLRVTGCQGRLACRHADVFAANSGTTLRFLTALVCAGQGEYRLDGVPRMRQRPVRDLVDALQQLNVEARCETDGKCPPVFVRAEGLQGGRVRMRGDISSQYLSGLLMVAPTAAADVEIEIVGPLVSKPYVEMTIAVMKAFGVEVQRTQTGRLQIQAPQVYQACNYQIEPDASAASYFWAAAAITRGEVTVTGLSNDSLQGDVRFCNCLADMGCEVDYGSDAITVRGRPLYGIDVDMNPISDTVQTLAVVALFANGPTTIRGVAHIRHKETDRIGDLARELRKLGAEVDEREDGLRIVPQAVRAAQVETYDDHRMAMSLALAGLKVPGVAIQNPACTAKTYPNFFGDLRTLVDPPPRA